MNVLPLEIRVRILAALVDGCSMRAVWRMTGVHRDTIMRLGITAGEACDRLHRARVHGLYVDLIEADEIWAYVGIKQGHIPEESDDERIGDQYTFVGFDPLSKLAINYLTGKRTLANTQAFADDLRMRVVGVPQINTDGFQSYPEALQRAFGTRHHHGIAIKRYAIELPPEEQRRYSPGTVIGVNKYKGHGSPDEDKITTSRVERQNLTMRMAMRRLTRLTNGFSKKVENLRAAIALHFGHYNWCRVHETLRVTPAMAAGLTDHIWSLAELLETALAQPETSPPGPVLAPPVRHTPVLRLIAGGRS